MLLQTCKAFNLKYTKKGWNKFIKEAVGNIAFKHIKSKTKHLKYDKFEMKRHQCENKNAKLIFNIRAGTLNCKYGPNGTMKIIFVLCACSLHARPIVFCNI